MSSRKGFGGVPLWRVGHSATKKRQTDESDEELDQRFGFDRVSDEGMLGHTALAALNLAVDCRRRRLVALPDE